MSYTCILHPKTEEDYIDAYDWYESKQEGLGEKFIASVRNKIQEISRNPQAFSSKSNVSFREAIVDDFPFLIVYKFNKEKKEIFIGAIHHMKKHPSKKYRNQI